MRVDDEPSVLQRLSSAKVTASWRHTSIQYSRLSLAAGRWLEHMGHPPRSPGHCGWRGTNLPRSAPGQSHPPTPRPAGSSGCSPPLPRVRTTLDHVALQAHSHAIEARSGRGLPKMRRSPPTHASVSLKTASRLVTRLQACLWRAANLEPMPPNQPLVHVKLPDHRLRVLLVCSSWHVLRRLLLV